MAIVNVFVFILVSSIVSLLWTTKSNENKPFGAKRYCYIGLGIGSVLGVLLHIMCKTDFTIAFLGIGLLTVSILSLFFIIINSFKEEGKPPKESYKLKKARVYITGDKHRYFKGVKRFCRKEKTSVIDTLIILGDSGFNYFGDRRDIRLKKKVSKFNITLFCIHGNKEERPQNIKSYGIKNFHGGKVYYEPAFPNILFAIDGESYTFNGHKYLVVGGAHSVDKNKCLEKGLPFWFDEMPSNKTKELVEDVLRLANDQIYGILTHTCPLKYLPWENFVTQTNRKPLSFKLDIDRSTEEWLDNIEENTNYHIWYCGHYHINKEIDKIVMLYNDIRLLGQQGECC